MSQPKFDVAGIGNAIVDVISEGTDEFLIANGVEKGGMTLIDEERAAELYGKMGAGIEVSGGSCANTIAGLAALGGKGAYIGKVRDDQLGTVFTHDIRALGVEFATPAAQVGPATARCLIVVTPDAQRSMSTYLGACAGLGPDDVPEELIEASAITYMEGYLWDPPAAKEAFLKAAGIAHSAGRLVSLTLSDSFCVDRFRDEFRHLAKEEVDILFANEAEIMSLYETDTFDAALQAVRKDCKFAALTRSEAGSVIVGDGEVHVVDAEKVSKVLDTTGAGDLYAAGFLYGLSRGADAVTCGRLGSIAAAEAISHYGARPQADLKKLVASKGLEV
ncbi:MAG: adenosine kinase [Parvibaculaceae bacterium]|jgi:sugar/nucleoside kinase (ribokinase family)